MALPRGANQLAPTGVLAVPSPPLPGR
jgi:hypothetical protein